MNTFFLKHQTLFIDEELLLCDCPGLVFPSFVATKGELILNGVLSVDHMRDYVEPINQRKYLKIILRIYFNFKVL